MDKTYDAILFRQRSGSPLQVAFAAASSEIDEWARVPTKKTGNIRNFQRAEIPKHVQEVERFFMDEANASPTAIVVGFDPTRGQDRVTLLGSDGRPLSEAEVVPGHPTPGKIRIAWEPTPESPSKKDLITAITGLEPRLRLIVFGDLADITELKTPALESVLNLFLARARSGKEPTDVPESPDATDTDTDTEIPEAAAAFLAGLTPNERQIVAGRLWFLASADPQVVENKSEEYLRVLLGEMRDELKPGLIIDGQHRVNGTKKLANIPFLVTALPTARWPELAFQFIVTNRTARRVPESLLISIIGNSLSRSQRGQIEQRLHEANIRVGLIEAVMRVHEEEQSPFFGMIAFGLANEQGFLDAAAVRGKVIQLWYERQGVVQDLFDHLCQGKRKSDRTEYWKDEELWFEYFVAFWSTVRDRYAGSAVFSSELVEGKPTSALMRATVLGIFQNTILQHISKYLTDKANTEEVPISESLPNSSKLSLLVKNNLGKLTPDFFVGWKITGFDGSRGAGEDLANAIETVISGGATVAKLKQKGHRLYKEESSKER